MDLGRPSGFAGYKMLLASGPQRPLDHCFKLRTKLLGAVMDRLGRPNGCGEKRHGPAVGPALSITSGRVEALAALMDRLGRPMGCAWGGVAQLCKWRAPVCATHFVL